MNNSNIIARVDHVITYRPVPFFKETEKTIAKIKKKLDLNLFCIKRPQQTCFIEVTSSSMVSWGIEVGDILVIEKIDTLGVNDLVVLEVDDHFQIYEFITKSNNEFIFLPIDRNREMIRSKNWKNLPIIGVVTNTIHQMRAQKKRIKFAA